MSEDQQSKLDNEKKKIIALRQMTFPSNCKPEILISDLNKDGKQEDQDCFSTDPSFKSRRSQSKKIEEKSQNESDLLPKLNPKLDRMKTRNSLSQMHNLHGIGLKKS